MSAVEDLQVNRMRSAANRQDATQDPATSFGNGETHTSGFFGQDVNASGIRSYNSDPNAFQYGGAPGGAEQRANTYQGLAASAQARGTPQINLAGANASAGMQGDALNQLHSQMLGQGPSVAQQQLYSGLGQAQNAAASTAASARGGGSNLAAAQRMGQQQQGDLAGQANQQAAQLRAGEQMNATNAYAGLAGQMRGQALGEQQAQAATGLAGMQMNDQRQLAYDQQADQVRNAQLNAQIAGQAQAGQNYNAAQGLFYNQQSGNAQRDQDTNKSIFGAAISGVGDLLGLASDERLKTGVQLETENPYADAVDPSLPLGRFDPAGDPPLSLSTLDRTNPYADAGQSAVSWQAGAHPVQDMGKQANALATQYQHNASSGPSDPVLGGIGSVGRGLGSAGRSLMSDERNKEAVAREGMDLAGLRASLDTNAQERDANAARRNRAPAGDVTDAQAAKLAAEAADMQKRQDAMYTGSTRAPARSPRMNDAKAADMARIAEVMKGEQGAMYGSPTQAGQGAAPAQMMDALTPYSFNYRPGVPGEDPARRNYGVMAQDLQRSPMGASIVEDTPTGKVIDVRKGVGANLAMSANLHHRLSALEAAYRSTSPLAGKLESDPYRYGGR